MKEYLNAKLILFKDILSKKTSIISDKTIKPFNILNQIAKKKKLKIFDINNDLEKFKNASNLLSSDYKSKNFAMAFQAAKLWCKR